MVNAVRSGDSQPVRDLIEFDLEIIPYAPFTLDDPCNLVLLEPFVHTSLDLYAFIALTPSSSTVNELIEMVKSDNDRRQQEMDRKGIAKRRSFNFHHPSFTNPEYELLSLHPEHFLPRGAVLPIYDPATRTCRNYVPSRDRRLRESIEPDSPRLPPFRHDFQNCEESNELNIFLVTLNAEIKCRRYLKMIQQQPPTTPLPDDVLALMRRVVELVDLLYWVPVPTEGSKGHAVQTQRLSMKRKNARSSQPQYTETTSDEEGGMKGLPTPTEAWKLAKRSRRIDWLAFPDVESRKAYGSALMSGHDIDYDPALFENAFPLDDPPRLYSDNAAMETWNQGVTILQSSQPRTTTVFKYVDPSKLASAAATNRSQSKAGSSRERARSKTDQEAEPGAKRHRAPRTCLKCRKMDCPGRWKADKCTNSCTDSMS